VAQRLEHAGRRFVYGVVDKPYRLPLIAVSAFGAIMLGLFLGNGAVSQINPIYFQGAAVHPRDRGAAIDPNSIAPAGPEYPLYGFGEGRAARLEACQGCVVRPPVEYASYSAPAPYFGSREERASADARALRAIDEDYDRREQRAEVAREREAAVEPLDRYMHYPVVEEPGPRAEPSAHPEKDEEEGAPVQE